MDDLDILILKSLEENGNLSGPKLASLIGIGTRTLQRRMDNLRKKGVYKAVLIPDFKLFGLTAWARIGIKVDSSKLYQVAQFLVERSYVNFVTLSFGTYNIFIEVTFPTLDRLTYFLSYELNNIEGITDKETILLEQPFKYYNHVWTNPVFNETTGSFKCESYKPHKQYQPSDIDREIIHLQLSNGYMSSADISKKLGVSTSFVRMHLKNMKESQLIIVGVIINKNIMEYEAWATIGINISNFNDKMFKFFVDNPNVYLASLCIGRFDLLIAVHFQNIETLMEFINTTLVSVEGIKSIQTFLHGKPIKYINTMLTDTFTLY